MKRKALKQLSNGVVITSLSAVGGRGEARLRANFDPSGISADREQLAKKIQERASLWFDQKAQQKSDNFNYDSIADVLPAEGDFITVPFRALSKTIVQNGHYLDFTTGTVLQDATQKLFGQTVYPNHDFTDINNALGSVAAVEWDGEDTAGKGAPGINAVYKIDALMNPRISRLLLMKPPGIHSTSMTFMFDFEFSHPDLVEEGKFWMLLGEEVGGSIVRLVVTEIHEFWEASLVFQGADVFAKQIPGGEGDEESFAAELAAKGDAEIPPPNSNEEKTMNIPKEKRVALGIGFDGDDVPETEIFKALESQAAKVDELSDANKLAELTAAAEAGTVLLEEKRTAVMAKAKLAELGSDEGDLDEIVVEQVNSADAATLGKLDKYFDKRIGDRFPNGRSSEEDSKDVDSLVADTDDTQTAGEDPTAGLL